MSIRAENHPVHADAKQEHRDAENRFSAIRRRAADRSQNKAEGNDDLKDPTVSHG